MVVCVCVNLCVCVCYCFCVLTELHSDRISHWLHIFSWQVDLVTGFSDEPHSSGATVMDDSVPLLWTCVTWRQMIWRCWVPGPHLVLQSDHSPTSQLWVSHRKQRDVGIGYVTGLRVFLGDVWVHCNSPWADNKPALWLHFGWFLFIYDFKHLMQEFL